MYFKNCLFVPGFLDCRQFLQTRRHVISRWLKYNLDEGFLARTIIVVKGMTFYNFSGILTQEERVEDVGGVLYWSCPLATALPLLPAS